MNIKIIGDIAKKHPAIARTIEAALISCVLYVLGSLVEGEAFSLHAALVALVTPVYLGLSKYDRDKHRQ